MSPASVPPERSATSQTNLLFRSDVGMSPAVDDSTGVLLPSRMTRAAKSRRSCNPMELATSVIDVEVSPCLRAARLDAAKTSRCSQGAFVAAKGVASPLGNP